MGELGCFPLVFNFPEKFFVPHDRKFINTQFRLYTQAQPFLPSNFSNLDSSIDNIHWSSFNPQLPTIFYVHGYMSIFTPDWTMPVKNAFLSYQPCNVFNVDWSDGNGLPYSQAIANGRVVGAEIALFIQKLQRKTGIKPESIHIIGHSLGAHVAGFAGKRVKNVGRITGLDPAGPLFYKVHPEVRLDRSDANFVDVIHTNGAPTTFQGVGMTESVAHFDFYVNGGHIQPSCPDVREMIPSFFESSNFFNFPKWVQEGLCSHGRALYLFISSIKNSNVCEMWAAPCNTVEAFNAGACGYCKSVSAYGMQTFCVPLGLHSVQYAKFVVPGKSVDFFVNTTDHEPYCIR